ncbi:MAG: DUF2066 domain-containing protein [Alphaproteobacteria bacterium]|nr:DUF2066 domain-containing protein [Alphaproteobacteria bacterium]
MRRGLNASTSAGAAGRRLAPVLLAILAVFVPAGARAADEVFTVYDVKVDVTAASARDARVKALDEARSAAFRQLLERLTVAQDHAQLPEASPQELVDAELSVEVAREKASSVRYIAEVTYSFRPELVRDFLRQHGLSYTESQARPMLVVPVLVQQAAGDPGTATESVLLWEPENDWAPVWVAPRFRSGLLPVVTPLGDTEDLLKMTGEAAREADWTALEPLASRYGVGEVLVAIARVTHSPDGRAERVDVELRRVRPDGEELAVGAMEGPSAPAQPGQTRAPALSRDLAVAAVDMAMAGWIEAWKDRTLVSPGEESRIAATAIFHGGLSDWTAIRTALADDANVRASEIKALSATGAEIELSFAGTVEQLALTLAQRNVSLSVLNGLWLLEAGTQATGLAPSAVGPGERPPISQVFATPFAAPPPATAAIPGESEDWNRALGNVDPERARMAPIPSAAPGTAGQ